MIEFSSVVAFILILTQVVKKAFAVKTSFVPLMSMIIGFTVVGAYALLSKGAVFTAESFFQTMIAIATANGIYASTSATIKG